MLVSILSGGGTRRIATMTERSPFLSYLKLEALVPLLEIGRQHLSTLECGRLTMFVTIHS